MEATEASSITEKLHAESCWNAQGHNERCTIENLNAFDCTSPFGKSLITY